MVSRPPSNPHNNAYAMTDNQSAEPGSIAGWASVRLDSLRFVNFANPRTGQIISGLCLELAGPDRSVWMNNRNGWRRADGWMRSIFLKKVDEERSSGSIDTTLPIDSNAEIDPL